MEENGRQQEARNEAELGWEISQLRAGESLRGSNTSQSADGCNHLGAICHDGSSAGMAVVNHPR